MITRKKYGEITWVNLENPTTEEVLDITKEFDIFSLVADELQGPSVRGKVDSYENCIYLILHFPIFRHSDKQKESWELDFVIGKDFLVTSHYEPVLAIHEFEKVIERDMVLEKRKDPVHAGMIFFSLVKHLQQSVFEHLEEVAEDISSIEEGIFSNKEKEMVRYIALINHEVLDLKRALHSHHRIFLSLENSVTDIFGAKFLPYVKALSGQSEKLWDKLDHLKESLYDLRETNDSLLSSKTNEVMKSLTMMALMTFPLTLVAAIFSTRAEAVPIIGNQYDFWMILGIMGGILVCMLAYFKFRKWL